MTTGNWKLLGYQETESPFLCIDGDALYHVSGIWAEFEIEFTDDAGKSGKLVRTEVVEVDAGEAMDWHDLNEGELELFDYEGDADRDDVWDAAPSIPVELREKVEKSLPELEILAENEGEFSTQKIARLDGAYQLRSYNGGSRGASQSARKAWTTESYARVESNLTASEAVKLLAEWGKIEIDETSEDGKVIELSDEAAEELLSAFEIK